MRNKIIRLITTFGLTALIGITVAGYPFNLSAPETNQGTLSSPKILGASDSKYINDTPIKARSENKQVSIKVPKKLKFVSLSAIKAKSLFVYDVNSGIVLVDKNSDFPLPIASLTKLMTAYVAYLNIDFAEIVRINQNDVFNVSPVIGVKIGDEISAGDLFNSMLIGSSNDSAKTLANYITKKTSTNFIDLMNEEAKQIGMSNTHFSNPLGFDSESNYSTAKDMELLVNKISEYSAFSLTSRKSNY